MRDREQVYALLGVSVDGEWFGGLQKFYNVPYENIMKVGELLGDKFLHVYQNSSPTISDFLEFLSAYKEDTTFNGYVVSSERNDERVTIEALTTIKNDDTIMEYRSADELIFLEDNKLYAFWD